MDDSKVAVITGGAGGIGYEAAKMLAQHGTSIAILDDPNKIDPQKIEKIREFSPPGALYPCDLSDMCAIQNTIQAIAGKYGRIDILVNCTCSVCDADFYDITEKIWRYSMNVNVKAPFFAIQACVPHMLKTGGGRVINLSPIKSNLSDGRHPVYATAKAALNAMTREWAVDLCHDNIQVNSVVPGEDAFPPDNNTISDAITENIKNAASTIVFLALCKTPYVNGAQIYVDNGAHSCRQVESKSFE